MNGHEDVDAALAEVLAAAGIPAPPAQTRELARRDHHAVVGPDPYGFSLEPGVAVINGVVSGPMEWFHQAWLDPAGPPFTITAYEHEDGRWRPTALHGEAPASDQEAQP